MTPPKRLKIVFQSQDAAGHLSACYGLAQTLVARGHEVIFLLHESFKGQAAQFGCREIIFQSTTKPSEVSTEAAANPIADTATQLLSTGILGPKNPLEKLRIIVQNASFIDQVYNRLLERNDQIEAVIREEKPDLFILDLFLILPAIQKSTPFVSIFSGGPLFLYDTPKLPPGCSGYSTTSDPSTWTEFKRIFSTEYLPLMAAAQAKLNAHFNYTPSVSQNSVYPNLEKNITKSPYLNVYGYPAELDYQQQPNAPKLPQHFIQVDAFCRQEAVSNFTLPPELKAMSTAKSALIYFSMGSMGGVDVNLMKRLLAILAKTPYKYIVSKGPRAGEYTLPANCWGEAYLPQTAILPLVDLVITHGGNNSFTEAFSFGKKMIVLPLFVDQYDNGTRIAEMGFGATFNPYDLDEVAFVATIARLLADEGLRKRLQVVAERIKRENRKVKACEAIEKLVA